MHCPYTTRKCSLFSNFNEELNCQILDLWPCEDYSLHRNCHWFKLKVSITMWIPTVTRLISNWRLNQWGLELSMNALSYLLSCVRSYTVLNERLSLRAIWGSRAAARASNLIWDQAPGGLLCTHTIRNTFLEDVTLNLRLVAWGCVRADTCVRTTAAISACFLTGPARVYFSYLTADILYCSWSIFIIL